VGSINQPALLYYDLLRSKKDSSIDGSGCCGCFNRVYLFLLMPDHLHGIASFPEHIESMNQKLASWKRLTSRRHKINWQKGFFDHRLRNDKAFEEKAAYIRMNPVRAELCNRPEEWPYFWTPEG